MVINQECNVLAKFAVFRRSLSDIHKVAQFVQKATKSVVPFDAV